MIKLIANYLPHRQAHLIGLGLSDGNLALLQQGHPIFVCGEELDLPAPGCDIVIYYGKDREAVHAFLAKTLEWAEEGQSEADIQVLHIDGKFYLAHMSRVDGRVMYMLGLDDIACDYLKGGGLASFRQRFVEGQGTSVEILLFWGETEEAMRELFLSSGLVGPNTKVREA